MHIRLGALLCLSSVSILAADPERLAEAWKLHRERNFTEALSAFESILHTEPENPDALFGLGYAQMELQDLESSARTFEKLVSLHPEVARYHHGLGDAYGLSAQKASIFSQMGLAKKCIAAYQRAVSLEPDNVAYRRSCYEFYAAAPAIVGGGRDKAAAELAEIEQRDPIQATMIRVELLLRDKKPGDALALLKALRKKRPESMVVAYQIGRVAALSGLEPDTGITALEAYLTHTPEPNAPPIWAAHWRLAMVLEKKGDTVSARPHYEEALRLKPDCAEAREALRRLAP